MIPMEFTEIAMGELTDTELDAVSGGHLVIVQNNIAVQIAFVIGDTGNIWQVLGQSNSISVAALGLVGPLLDSVGGHARGHIRRLGGGLRG